MSDEDSMTVDEIERASTLDDAERAELQNPGYEIFIAALSILSIVNLLLMTLVDDKNLDYVLLDHERAPEPDPVHGLLRAVQDGRVPVRLLLPQLRLGRPAGQRPRRRS